MPMYVIVHPRFGDGARLALDGNDRPQLVAEIGPTTVLSVQVDDEPGSTELAAQFARELASAATRFAARCEETLRAPAVALPAASRDGRANSEA
jgi:hypothetical protein